MKHPEDFYEKCWCNKVLAKPQENQENNTNLVFECDKCGYTYVICFEQLLEA